MKHLFSSTASARGRSVGDRSRIGAGASPTSLHAPARVVLCGDALAENAWVLDALEGAAHRVETCRTARDASRILEADPRALMILECAARSSHRALVELVRQLPRSVQQRTIAVTWRAPWSVVRALVDVGIGDFLDMPTTASELLLRVDLRLRDTRERDSRSAALLSRSASLAVEAFAATGMRFSKREARLFALLAERMGDTVNRAEILDRVWHRERAAATTNLVDVYVHYLRAKLARVAPELTITTVRSVGYRLERAPEVVAYST